MGQGQSDLRRTRASLFYLVTYLFPFAAGLLISPTGTFHLLGSRGEHATIAWRLFGGLLLMRVSPDHERSFRSIVNAHFGRS